MKRFYAFLLAVCFVVSAYATTVSLPASFNNWNQSAMMTAVPGVENTWTYQVILDESGETPYEFKVLADGAWLGATNVNIQDSTAAMPIFDASNIKLTLHQRSFLTFKVTKAGSNYTLSVSCMHRLANDPTTEAILAISEPTKVALYATKDSLKQYCPAAFENIEFSAAVEGAEEMGLNLEAIVDTAILLHETADVYATIMQMAEIMPSYLGQIITMAEDLQALAGYDTIYVQAPNAAWPNVYAYVWSIEGDEYWFDVERVQEGGTNTWYKVTIPVGHAGMLFTSDKNWDGVQSNDIIPEAGEFCYLLAAESFEETLTDCENHPTAIEAISASDYEKYLENGTLFVKTGDAIYTATGVRVK